MQYLRYFVISAYWKAEDRLKRFFRKTVNFRPTAKAKLHENPTLLGLLATKLFSYTACHSSISNDTLYVTYQVEDFQKQTSSLQVELDRTKAQKGLSILPTGEIKKHLLGSDRELVALRQGESLALVRRINAIYIMPWLDLCKVLLK